MQLDQVLALEFVRLGLIFVHLIACCVAIGLVLTSDIAMVKQLLGHDTPARPDTQLHMEQLQKTVVVALTVLWITGLTVVTLDAASKGLEYFANPKLQAKILLVVLLTLNGVVLHQVVLPWMQKAGSLLDMSPSQTTFAVFSGAVSGVSWLYVAMLGVGRPLSWKYSLLELMAAYPVLIAGGFISMLLLTAIGKRSGASAGSEFAAT